VPNQTSERGNWNSTRSRSRGPAAQPAAAKTEYQLGQQLEAGSTGEVYEASHPWLPGRFVVKVLSPGLAQLRAAVEIFRTELSTISSLRHPNIVQIVEVGEMPQDGRPFVVMERLEGRSLEARIADGRPMPPDEVAALVKGAAGALQAAHARGVVHRELHPGNIFLASAEGHEYGFAKILNFGIARLRNASGGDAGVGAEEARYMAPEQAQGRAEEIDGRTDEFALAAITYRLLCGADAFRGVDPIAVLYQVVHEAPEPMSAYAVVDARVEDVVLRGLSKRQTERFGSVLEFARAFEEAVVEKPMDERTGGGVFPRGAVAGRTGRTPAPRRSGGEVVAMPTGQRREALQPESRLPDRPRGFTPYGANAMALPGGGVLRDEPLWHVERSDDYDEELDRVPHHGWRLAAFVAGFAIVCAGAALWAGWQPPLAWRQSPIWHTLRLPRAAEPNLPQPAQPAQPPAPESFPAPASPPPVTGATAPAPSAPATARAGSLVPREAPPAAAVTPPAPAAALPAPASPEAQPATPTADEAAAARAERRPRAREPRARTRHEPRENMHLRGLVWSEREQRLVPADAPPAAGPMPAPSAEPSPAPAARPLPPADAPLPLSPAP
jgi:serine/threonine-protein kinase